MLSAGGTGQTAAVRRQCGGNLNCDQICKGISKKCIESVHMYGNDAADDVHKKGMFTHLYGSCTSGGCGPNYCCCTDNPGNMKSALAVVGVTPDGGLDQNGSLHSLLSRLLALVHTQKVADRSPRLESLARVAHQPAQNCAKMLGTAAAFR